MAIGSLILLLIVLVLAGYALVKAPMHHIIRLLIIAVMVVAVIYVILGMLGVPMNLGARIGG